MKCGTSILPLSEFQGGPDRQPTVLFVMRMASKLFSSYFSRRSPPSPEGLLRGRVALSAGRAAVAVRQVSQQDAHICLPAPTSAQTQGPAVRWLNSTPVKQLLKNACPTKFRYVPRPICELHSGGEWNIRGKRALEPQEASHPRSDWQVPRPGWLPAI